jgi:hypothetical protein
MSDWLEDLLAAQAEATIPYDFSAFAEQEAEKVGCVVVYPEANQLQIDLDTEEAFIQHEKRMMELYQRTVFPAYRLAVPPVVTPSKSGYPHRHITLVFEGRTFNEWERIGMQLALGSDPVREALNALRLATGVKQPCRLFELKP